MLIYAGVAELADAPDLGSGGVTRGGSSPFSRTIKNLLPLQLQGFFCIHLYEIKAKEAIGMQSNITRQKALELLQKYNQESFHLLHALTVESVMKWYANELGFHDEIEYWGIVGLLHDIDFELYPQEHCKKAAELLREASVDEAMIYSICSHGYGICVDIEPKHQMEKILFATDELTGLIGAAARMRPSKSVLDMEVSSLKKKYKDKKFAAGCSREVINKGAAMLGWELNMLFEKTISAMRSCEAAVEQEIKEISK